MSNDIVANGNFSDDPTRIGGFKIKAESDQNWTIPRVGRFEKVSLEQFKKDIKEEFYYNQNNREEII